MKHMPYNTYAGPRPKSLRGDMNAGLDAQQWGTTIIMLIVVIILVTALIGTLTTQLGYFAENETVIGPTVELLVPILISMAILLAAVGALLKWKGGSTV